MAKLVYDKNGIIVGEEEKAESKNSKLSWIIAMQNKVLIKEQQYNKKNTCHKCHLVKSKTGECNCN